MDNEYLHEILDSSKDIVQYIYSVIIEMLKREKISDFLGFLEKV